MRSASGRRKLTFVRLALLFGTGKRRNLGLKPSLFFADKISQTGDLTNLSGLPDAELAVLPTLLRLRNALYSETFRSFVQGVTGCGPLSGIKTDMSCAEYGEGSYLLNHDDVIGTRRISFILYLVADDPEWRKEVRSSVSLCNFNATH